MKVSYVFSEHISYTIPATKLSRLGIQNYYSIVDI